MAQWDQRDPRWLVKELGTSGSNVNGWHWEETSKISWARTRLSSLLKDLEASLSPEKGEAAITGTKDVKGEVSILIRICLHENAYIPYCTPNLIPFPALCNQFWIHWILNSGEVPKGASDREGIAGLPQSKERQQDACYLRFRNNTGLARQAYRGRPGCKTFFTVFCMPPPWGCKYQTAHRYDICAKPFSAERLRRGVMKSKSAVLPFSQIESSLLYFVRYIGCMRKQKPAMTNWSRRFRGTVGSDPTLHASHVWVWLGRVQVIGTVKITEFSLGNDEDDYVISVSSEKEDAKYSCLVEAVKALQPDLVKLLLQFDQEIRELQQ